MNLREKLQILAKKKILVQQKAIEKIESKGVKKSRVTRKRISAPIKHIEQITVAQKSFFPEIPPDFQYRKPAEASGKSEKLIELLNRFNNKQVKKVHSIESTVCKKRPSAHKQ